MSFDRSINKWIIFLDKSECINFIQTRMYWHFFVSNVKINMKKGLYLKKNFDFPALKKKQLKL